MDLNEIRNRIDNIDEKLVELLNNRMELSVLAGQQKKVIRDEKREDEIVEKAQDRASANMHPEFYKSLYGIIFTESRRLQEWSYRFVDCSFFVLEVPNI